jgi:hypothetical protein
MAAKLFLDGYQSVDYRGWRVWRPAVALVETLGLLRDEAIKRYAHVSA